MKRRAAATSAGRAALLLAALVGACGGGGDRGAGPEGRDEDPRAATYAADPRLAPLLAACPRGAYYDRNTSDVLPILIDKLRHGRADVLKRAKEELGALGDASVPALRRLFEESYTDPVATPWLQNAVGALVLNRSDAVHPILLAALEHPQEVVRREALVGFVTDHARPEDFDHFRARLDGPEPDILRRMAVKALFRADRARAEALVLDWLREGERSEFWDDALPLLAQTRSETTRAACAEVFRELPPRARAWVAAPAARGGSEEARAALRRSLDEGEVGERLLCVRAASLAGLPEVVAGALVSDPADEVRAVAVAALAEPETLDEEHREWLRAALDDSAALVSSQALQRLCRAGDEGAIDRALAQLASDTKLLQEALQALREPMTADPALAERAWRILVARHEGETHRPVQQRTATYKAMGVVPLAEAARFLRAIGLEFQDERLEGLRAHEWLTIQASNTGEPGRAWLGGALAEEDDPLRRLDLIAAVSASRDEATRERLLRFVEEGARSPYEVLFAASKLVQIGPARLVAPRLKAAAYALEDPPPRNALHCLLVAWY